MDGLCEKGHGAERAYDGGDKGQSVKDKNPGSRSQDSLGRRSLAMSTNLVGAFPFQKTAERRCKSSYFIALSLLKMLVTSSGDKALYNTYKL